MLQIRLRVPSDLVDRVLEILTEDETVTDVASHRDAFHKPRGCLITAVVARENATSVLAALQRLNLEDVGSIIVDPIDTVLSHGATRAERAAPGAPDDGVVWMQVENKLREDSKLTWVFLAFMVLACSIAGVGRITDQPILIVGAMVVGPDFAPVAAICLALSLPRMSMLFPAARSLVLGFTLATLITAGGWFVAYAAGTYTTTEAGSGTQTNFIIHPDSWSFVVACLAGIAGTLSLTTNKSGPLVGVFISVTTIPAVGTLALCLGCGVWSEVGGALLQLAINISGMIVAGTATILVERRIWRYINNRTAGRLQSRT